MEIKALFQTGMAAACLTFCLTACEEDQTLHGWRRRPSGTFKWKRKTSGPASN